MRKIFVSILCIIGFSQLSANPSQGDNLQAGDTFTAETAEGVNVLYKVLRKSPMQVEVSCTEDYDACIDMDTKGKVTIPQVVNGYTVVGLSSSAFSRCRQITQVTLPTTVTYLGSNAFSSCDALESIEGLDAVTSLGRLAISYCKSLKAIKLPETLTFIGAQGFRGCSSLTSLYIPKNVQEIEANFVLAGDNALTSIEVSPENKYYHSADGCNAIIEKSTNTLVAGCSKTTIPNTVTSLGDGAFTELESLEEITIPASVKSFGYMAFEGCINLKSIYSLTAEPFDIQESVFKCFPSSMADVIFNNATLYIPDGTLSLYRSKTGWKKFAKIVEATEKKSDKRGDVNHDGAVNVADVVATIDFKNKDSYDADADLDNNQKVNLSDVDILVQLIMSQRVPYSKDAVDLGLSVKWAKMNVGATNPEDFGSYYAWAETADKDTYSWSNYKYANDDGTQISKYCNSSSYGTIDGLTTVQTMDDAARVNMGQYWRMPTKEEWNELVERCTWTRENLNNVAGYRVTGPNGNSIFLPFGGQKSKENYFNSGSVGYYWASNLSGAQSAPAIYMYSSKIDFLDYSRYMGMNIRPVLRTSAEDDDPRMDDVVPVDMRERLKDYMPIFNGINPPNIEGAYLASPYTTVYCEDGQYEVGRVIDPYKVKFSNQNNINNTIDMMDYNNNNTDNYNIGKGAFITGNGECFTAFFATEGYSRGIYNKQAIVISGRKTSAGIRDYYYGLLMVDKAADPDKKLMDIGYFRIFKDGDSISEPTTWDLSSGARRSTPKDNERHGNTTDGPGK